MRYVAIVLVSFILGVIVAWKGCGTSYDPVDVKVIDKPTHTVHYVDRWKTDTVRFVKTRIKYDTINTETATERIVIDTLYSVDTLKIVEAWLTEEAKYDTTLSFSVGDVRMKWKNYQNLSENLVVEVYPKSTGKRFALGVHGNVGVISDFKQTATPIFGIGIQSTIKKTYFSVNYGFNGQHYTGITVGTNFIDKR